MTLDAQFVQIVRISKPGIQNVLQIGEAIKEEYEHLGIKNIRGKSGKSENDKDFLNLILEGMGFDYEQRERRSSSFIPYLNEVTDCVLKSNTNKKLLAEAANIQDYEERMKFLLDAPGQYIKRMINDSVGYTVNGIIKNMVTSSNPTLNRKAIRIYSTNKERVNMTFMHLLKPNTDSQSIVYNFNSEIFENFSNSYLSMNEGEGFDITMDKGELGGSNSEVSLYHVDSKQVKTPVISMPLKSFEERFAVMSYADRLAEKVYEEQEKQNFFGKTPELVKAEQSLERLSNVIYKMISE